jgi:uncharacterized Zn ribbon protein
MDKQSYSPKRELRTMVRNVTVGAMIAVTAFTSVPVTAAYAAVDASTIKESESGVVDAPTDYIRLDANQKLTNCTGIYGVSTSGIKYAEPYSGDLTISDFKEIVSDKAFTVDPWGTDDTYCYYLVFLKPDDGYLLTNLVGSGLGNIYSTQVAAEQGESAKSYYGNLGNYPNIIQLCTDAYDNGNGYTAVLGWARWNTDKGICNAYFNANAVKPTLDVSAVPENTTNYASGKRVTFDVTIKTNPLEGVPQSDYDSGNIVAEAPVPTKVTVSGTECTISNLVDNGDGTYSGTVGYTLTQADIDNKGVTLVVDADQAFSCKLGSGSLDIRTKALATAEGSTWIDIVADQSVEINSWEYDGTFHGDTLVSTPGYDPTYAGTPTYTYYKVTTDADGNEVLTPVDGEPTEPGDYRVVATWDLGKSGSTATAEADFKITPLAFTVEPLEDVVYNGEAQPQKPVVKDENGNVLAEGKDYELVYKDADGNVIDPDDIVDVANYKVEVVGLAGFAGTTGEVDYDVTPLPIDNTFTVEAPEDVVYNGEAQPGKPVVKDPDGNVLEEGKDYTLTYKDADGNVVEDPTDVANYTVVVTGIGNYSGEQTTDYDITPWHITNRNVDETTNFLVTPVDDVTYNGTSQPQKPVVTDPSGNVLEEGKDYVLIYKDADGNIVDPTEPGNYTVSVHGLNNYTDEVTVDYDITPLDVTAPEDVVYNGESQEQKPVVKNAAGEVLVEGIDYELVYSEDTTNVGTVTVTVKGIGKYSGEVETSYKITPAKFAVEAPADVTYNGKSQEEKPVVKGPNGETLVEGKDYELVYSEDTTNPGTVKVTVKGLGNYEGMEIETSYQIKDASSNKVVAKSTKAASKTSATKSGTAKTGDASMAAEALGATGGLGALIAAAGAWLNRKRDNK